MTAPFVKEILLKIEKSSSLVERACLQLDLACYYSRAGDFSQACRIKDATRLNFGKGENISVTIRLLCLDAHLLMFRDESRECRDRMARANLLSKASGDRVMVAFTAAWLAMMDLNNSDFFRMRECVIAALESMGEGTAPAECRVAIVLAMANQLAENSSESVAWYNRGRNLSVKLGDQAAIGALIFNQAAFRLLHCRMDAMRGQSSSSKVEALRVDVQSAISYQEVSGISSLGHWLNVIRIGSLVVQEQFVDAERELLALMETATLRAGTSNFYAVHSDRLVILVKTGRLSEALLNVPLIESRLADEGCADDKAQLADSLQLVAQAEENFDKAERWRRFRNDQLRDFEALKSDLRNELSIFSEGRGLGFGS